MSTIFFQKRRVTVTGGAGFLGSFVVERLRAKGAEVFVPRGRDYDLYAGEAIRTRRPPHGAWRAP